jgi:hypothetical protein
MAGTKTLFYENTTLADKIFTLPDDDASVDNIQMTVILGTVYCKGATSTLFGEPTTEVPLYPGQSINFIIRNIEPQGKRIFRIPAGAKVTFVAD